MSRQEARDQDCRSARGKGKGKGKEVVSIELEKERTWLRRKIRETAFFLSLQGRAEWDVEKEKREKEEIESKALREQQEIERGEFFECGCCFGECGFSQLGASSLFSFALD